MFRVVFARSSCMNQPMFPPRFMKERNTLLAAALVPLIVWAVLSNRSSSQAAAVPCSAPSFPAAKLVNRINQPGDIRSGDFNGDHHLDVVILSGNEAAILLGDGAGNFTTPTFFPAGDFFSFFSLAVADVNGDGKLDVVRAGFESSSATKGQLSVLLGDGAGGFGAPKLSQTDGHYNDIALADFNGDGKLDIAASSETGVWVIQGDGTGSFGGEVRYQTAGSFLSAIKVADFNGDGKSDVVTTKPNSDSVSVLLNNGGGLFNTVKEFPTSTTPVTLLAGDFNGDGKADVITAGAKGDAPNNISVLLGDGAGNLAAPINTPSDSTSLLSSGDFNGDGKPDLIRAPALGPLAILFGDGTGHFDVPREFNLGDFSSSLYAVAGDFNEDGKLDVATSYMTVSLGDGAGGLQTARSFRVGDEPALVAAGDFNEDGKRDLVVANSKLNEVSLLIQNGTGDYAPATSLSVGLKPSFIAVADFNGDHHLDFVTANNNTSSPGTVSVRLGDGTGNFAAAHDFPSGNAPKSLVVVDINQDGKLDLVVANEGYVKVTEAGLVVFPPSVSILIGDGAGGFAAPRALSNELPNMVQPTLANTVTLSIAAADLNNDSKLDLVVADFKTVSVLLGDGTGQFGTAITYASDTIINSLVVGDFDRDGKQDVAVAGSNTVSTRSGDGTGHLGPTHDFAVGLDPTYLSAGDFNSDSNLDLVASNAAMVAVTLGDGAGSFGTPTLFNFSAKATTVDDLNGDGKPDIAMVPSGVGTNHISVLRNTCGASVTPTPTPTPTPSPTPFPPPVLLTEQGTNHALALESVTFTRDPFTVRTRLNLSADQRTRIILFASNLVLLPGENASNVIVQADSQGKVIPVVVEDVETVPGLDWLTQVIVKLPDELEAAGDVQVSISLHSSTSNKGVITIKASDP